MKVYPVGLDYKYKAQEQLHHETGGDLGLYFRACAGAIAELKQKYGAEFEVGLPEGWTAPKLDGDALWKPAGLGKKRCGEAESSSIE